VGKNFSESQSTELSLLAGKDDMPGIRDFIDIEVNHHLR
jgi:hypothetical protein